MQPSPTGQEFELEEATKRLTHDNVVNHIRHCNDCKNSIARELGVELNEVHKDSQQGRGDHDSAELADEEPDRLGDLMEILTFVFAGAILILVLDGLLRLGKMLKK